MISAALIGDKSLIERLGRVAPAMKKEVDATVMKLGFELQARVQTQKLTGQVLHVRTGRLKSSITQRFESTAEMATSIVGTNVSYGVMWEKGIAAHDVVPVKAKALRFEIGGQIFFRKKVHIPAQAARPFLEPALQEMRPQIVDELQKALIRGAQAAMKS